MYLAVSNATAAVGRSTPLMCGESSSSATCEPTTIASYAPRWRPFRSTSLHEPQRSRSRNGGSAAIFAATTRAAAAARAASPSSAAAAATSSSAASAASATSSTAASGAAGAAFAEEALGKVGGAGGGDARAVLEVGDVALLELERPPRLDQREPRDHIVVRDVATT